MSGLFPVALAKLHLVGSLWLTGDNQEESFEWPRLRKAQEEFLSFWSCLCFPCFRQVHESSVEKAVAILLKTPKSQKSFLTLMILSFYGVFFRIWKKKIAPWEVRGCSSAAGIHHSRAEAGEVAETGALLPTGSCWKPVKFTSSTEQNLDLSLAFPPSCASAIFV